MAVTCSSSETVLRLGVEMRISQGGEKERRGTGFYHYDRENKEDHFAGGLIAAAGMEADIDGLPEEERLNF